ncbi:MAG: hypothetical protein LUD46_13275 [Parabacteroides sp.]|nr:hypothetical protein [Parabacteroides sp.]
MAQVGAETGFLQAAEQLVGILARGDRGEADGETVGTFAGNLFGGTTSRGVAIEQEMQGGGVACEDLCLPVGQRRAAEGYGVAVSGGVHGEHVFVTLYHKGETSPVDRFGGAVDAVERAALVEQGAGGRVDVFGSVCVGDGLLSVVDASCPETRQPAVGIVDGEDQAAAHGAEGVGHE